MQEVIRGEGQKKAGAGKDLEDGLKRSKGEATSRKGDGGEKKEKET